MTLRFRSPSSVARNRRRGFTLIELAVVLGVLAILAALLVPRLAFVRTMAGYTNEAASIQDTLQNMLTYHATQAVWPTQFDTLLDSSGALYGTTGTNGLDTNLSPLLTASTLSGNYLNSFIGLLGQPNGNSNPYVIGMNHDQTSDPGMSGQASTGQIAKGGSFPAAFVTTGGTSSGSDPNSASTYAVLSPTYPGIYATGSPLTFSGSPVTVSGFSDGHSEQLVAIGVGPACTAVGKTIISPPQAYEKDPTRYNRTIVLVRVRSDGVQASLAGGLSPDGRTLEQCLGNYRVTAQR